jgi:hypothetical protein
MKQNYRHSSALKRTVQACFLALALSSSPGAFAVTDPKAAMLTDPAEIAAMKKATARAHAEKLRAIREARELEADAAGLEHGTAPLANATSSAHLLAPVPGLTKVGNALSAAPEMVAHKVTAEVNAYIHAAVSRLGVSPKTGAGTAGFLVGVSGPWMYSQVMGMPSGASLRELTLGAADVGAIYLESHYSVAEQAGRMTRYAVIAAMAAGLLFAARKLIFRNTAPRSRRTAGRNNKPDSRSETLQPTGSRMFPFFGRKSAKQTEKQEPATPVVLPFDMDTLRDYAFNLLFARGRHDLAGVGDMVTSSFARCLTNHFQTLEAKGHWNKIERVCSVQCEKGEAWQEGDTSYVKLLVRWKALDYIVNYNRRIGDLGYIVDGDPNTMESFEEEWIVTRRAGDSWLVDAMYPAPKKNPLAR